MTQRKRGRPNRDTGSGGGGGAGGHLDGDGSDGYGDIVDRDPPPAASGRKKSISEEARERHR